METPSQSRDAAQASEQNGPSSRESRSFSMEEITPLVIRGDQMFASIEEAEEDTGIKFLTAVCDGVSVDTAARNVNISHERINNLVSALQWIGLFMAETESSTKAVMALEDCETVTRLYAKKKYEDPKIANLMFVTKDDLKKCQMDEARPKLENKWAVMLGDSSAMLDITPRQRRKKTRLEIRVEETSNEEKKDKRLKLVEL